MKANVLISGKIYRDTKKDALVVFSRMSPDNKWAIVHPLGEPDMQSSWGMLSSDLVDEEPGRVT